MKSSFFMMFCFLIAIECFSQPCESLKGQVRDAQSGTPLPGASIRIINRIEHGITTDVNGEFEIIAEKKDTLLVTFVGYADQKFPLPSVVDCNVTFLLEPAAKNIESI